MKRLVFLMAAALTLTTINASEPFKAGDTASDFSLKNLSGKVVTLSQFENVKGLIVVFSCNTCPMVLKYEDRIIGLHNEFSVKGYPVVAINSNDRAISPGDSYEAMQRHASEKRYKFEYLYDESQDVAKKYGATNTPHVYVLSKDGNNFRVEYVGAIDNNPDDASKADKKYVSEAVNALLKNDQLKVTGTKAVGCGIKWKKV